MDIPVEEFHPWKVDPPLLEVMVRVVSSPEVTVKVVVSLEVNVNVVASPEVTVRVVASPPMTLDVASPVLGKGRPGRLRTEVLTVLPEEVGELPPSPSDEEAPVSVPNVFVVDPEGTVADESSVPGNGSPATELSAVFPEVVAASPLGSVEEEYPEPGNEVCAASPKEVVALALAIVEDESLELGNEISGAAPEDVVPAPESVEEEYPESGSEVSAVSPEDVEALLSEPAEDESPELGEN